MQLYLDARESFVSHFLRSYEASSFIRKKTRKKDSLFIEVVIFAVQIAELAVKNSLTFKWTGKATYNKQFKTMKDFNAKLRVLPQHMSELRYDCLISMNGSPDTTFRAADIHLLRFFLLPGEIPSPIVNKKIDLMVF